MDINALYERILAAWSESDKQFKISGAQLEAEAITKLLTDFLGSDLLHLSEASKPELHDNRVRITDSLYPNSFLNLSDCQAKVVFYLDAQNAPQVDVSILPASATFSLSNAFPGLKNTAPGALPLSGAGFHLSSVPNEAANKQLEKLQQRYSPNSLRKEYEPRIVSGMRFSSTLSFGEDWDWIVQFLTGSTLELSGPVQLLDGVPRMQLRTSTNERAVGPFLLEAGFDVIGLFAVGERKEKESIGTVPANRLFGTLKIADSPVPELPVYALLPTSRPDTIRLESELGELSRYALSQFAALLSNQEPGTVLPSDFPGVTAVALELLEADINLTNLKPQMLRATFGMDKEQQFPIYGDQFGLSDIGLVFTVDDPFAEAVTLTGSVSGTLYFNSAAATGRIESHLTLASNDYFNFSSRLAAGSYIDLTAFVTNLVPVLPELPKVEITSLALDGTKLGKEVDFTIAGGIATDISVSLGLFDVSLKAAELTFSYESGEVSNKSVTLAGTIGLGENAEVYLRGGISSNGWNLAGTLAFIEPLKLSKVLPAELQILPPEVLDVSLKRIAATLNSEKQKLTLTIDASSHLYLEGIGRLECKRIAVDVEKTKNGHKWSVDITGGLMLVELDESTGTPWLIDMQGTLSIKADSENSDYTLQFKPKTGSGTISNIPLLLPYRFPPEGGIEWSEMSFTLSLIKIGYKEKKWAFDADFKLEFTKIIKELEMVLPKNGLDVGLHISTTEASLKLKGAIVDEVIPSITIPAVGDQIEPFETGQARFRLGDLTLKIENKKIGVSASLAYYLPANLNKLLGTEENGEPKIRLFDTFVPDQPDKAKPLQVEFTAAVGNKGVSIDIQLKHIPITILSEGDKDHWALEFGPESDPGKYGSIWIEKPILSLRAEGGFHARVGWDVKKDPAIPLDLLKRLLEAGSLEEVAKNLPETLPIPLTNPPKFISGTGPDRKLEWEQLESFFGVRWPDELRKLLDEISRKVARMPEDFTEYLNPQFPTTFHFEVQMKPGGSFELGFNCDPGFKLLMVQPAPTPFIPGFELRGLSIGSYFSGQLFSVRLDADFDLFDLPTLAGTVFLPEEWDEYLGNPIEFRRRLTIDQLLIFIVWQTQFPIPVPAFYNKVGFEYKGIGDITLKSSLSFPEPSFNLAEIGSVFKDLIQFFTQPDFPLNPEKEVTDFNLILTLGPTYLKTGKYMGSKVLGFEEEVELLNAYKLVAYLLNGIKFFDVVRFLQSIPIEHRNGRGKLATDFIGMSLEGAYLGVSPKEFLDIDGYKLLDFNDRDEAKDFMSILPSKGEPISEDDKGLILFLRGIWKTNYSEFDIGFGLLAIDAQRFNTGFLLSGKVAGLFDINLLATLKIQPPETPFELYGAGRANFQILNHTIFSGAIKAEASSTHLTIGGEFDLLPGNDVIYLRTTRPIEGSITESELEVSGAVEGRLGLFSASGSVDISKNGIDLSIRFLNDEGRFSMNVEEVEFRGATYDAVVTRGSARVAWSEVEAAVSIIPKTGAMALFTSSLLGGLIKNRIYIEAGIAGESAAISQLTVHLAPAINPNPIFKADGRIDEEGLHISADYNLFPEGSPIVWRGDITGHLNGDNYSIVGDAHFMLGDFGLKGDFEISDTAIAGKVGGTLLGYESGFGFELREVPEDNLVFGNVNLTIANLPVVSGSATVNAGHSELVFEGTLNLLNGVSLLFLESSSTVKGRFAPGVVDLEATVKGHIFLFPVNGSANFNNEGIELSLNASSLSVQRKQLDEGGRQMVATVVEGSLSVLWNSFSTTVVAAHDHNYLRISMQGAFLKELVKIETDLITELDRNIGVRGEIRIYALPQFNPNPVFKEAFQIDTDGMFFNGRFQLLPDGSPVNIIAENPRGRMQSDSFHLGPYTATLVLTPLALSGSVEVSKDEITGYFEDPLFVYAVRIDYNLQRDSNGILLGKTAISMLGLKLFDGSAWIAGDLSQLGAKGRLQPIDLGGLFYLGSDEEMEGQIGGTRFYLHGNIRARILIFEGSGSATLGTEAIGLKVGLLGQTLEYTIDSRENKLYLSGSLPFGFTVFTLRIWIDPAAEKVDVQLQSTTIAGLLDIILDFSNGWAAGREHSKNQIRIWILREQLRQPPILDGSIEFRPDGFYVDTTYHLLPEDSPLNISGRVRGTIRNGSFELVGDANVVGGGITLFKGEITISDRGISGSIDGALGKLEYSAVVCNGKLYLCGSLTPPKGPTVSAYLGPDPPFIFFGGCPCRAFRDANQLDLVEEEKSAPTMLATLYSSTNHLLQRVALEGSIAALARQPEADVLETGTLILEKILDDQYHTSVRIHTPNKEVLQSTLIATAQTKDATAPFFEDIAAAVHERSGIKLNVDNASVTYSYIPERFDFEGLVTLQLPKERAQYQRIEMRLSLARSKRFVPLLIAHLQAIDS